MAEHDPRASKGPEAVQPPADEANGEQQERSQREQELERQLEEAQQKSEENWNNFLRARAELENARRRAERDLEQAHKYGVEKLATELLPVRDSLEMGLAAAQEAGADVAKLREGTELTLKMLSQALERFKVTEIDPLGERFDPERHEAMAAQPSNEYEPNTVMHVVQKGYLLNDRVLRPAMVIVAKGGSEQPGSRIDDKA